MSDGTSRYLNADEAREVTRYADAYIENPPKPWSVPQFPRTFGIRFAADDALADLDDQLREAP